MKKAYKISYKTYFNKHLKKVSFHGLDTYPLYVYVTYRKATIYFKSYYFELLSNQRYSDFVAENSPKKVLDKIIIKEMALIKSMTENQDDFSLNGFKKDYPYYAIDLLTALEPLFIDSVSLFFTNQKLPSIAKMVHVLNGTGRISQLVSELRVICNTKLAKQLSKHVILESPPYLLLYSFMRKYKHSSLQTITMIEWSSPKVKKEFSAHLENNFSEHDLALLIKTTQDFINTIKS